MLRALEVGEKKPSTAITYDWGEDVVQSMRAGGLEVLDLGAKKLTRGAVESALRKYPEMDLVLHYGHGFDDCLLGSRGEAILDSNNVNLLQYKNVVAISCETADKFGYWAIEAGASAYIGFSEKSYIVFDENKNCFTGFKESANAWNTIRLDGGNVSIATAFNSMGQEYKKWRDFYRGQGYPDIAKFLNHNRDAMLVLGDEEMLLPYQNPVQLLPYPEVFPSELAQKLKNLEGVEISMRESIY